MGQRGERVIRIPLETRLPNAQSRPAEDLAVALRQVAQGLDPLCFVLGCAAAMCPHGVHHNSPPADCSRTNTPPFAGRSLVITLWVWSPINQSGAWQPGPSMVLLEPWYK